MKQGTFATKMIMIFLLVGILTYLAIYIIQALSTPYETELVYRFTVEDTISTNGYVIRDEEILPQATGGLVEIIPAEGEQIGAGQTVAKVYQSESALQEQQELDDLTAQLDQLLALSNTSEENVDKLRLDEEIVEQIFALRSAVCSQSFSHLDTLSLELKNLVFKREYTTSQEVSLTSLIDELSDQVAALTRSTAQSSSSITVSKAGTFSGLLDGYETVLTVDKLEELTPSSFRSLTETQVENQGIGKLILGHTWYFATIISQADAEMLTEGDTATVRLVRDVINPVEMELEWLSEPENGQVLAIFSSSRYLSQVTLLRQASADIISDTHSGLRISKDAARVLEDGTVGVYCLTGLQSEFKPITITYEGETFYLVEEDTTNPNGLKSGDEILVVGQALYDGKVVS